MKKLLLLAFTFLFVLTPTIFQTNASVNAQSQDNELQCGSRICLRSTAYFLLNYRRLKFFPRDILISGVNLNHPVEVTSVNTILLTLRNPSTSPLAEFNRQYVTAQLSMALTPLFSVYSGVKSSIGCYGVDFQPVKLSTGAIISPASSLETLFSQCDVVAILPPDSEERNQDMRVLAQILARLNGTCR
ncbi:MAG: hypothetical protein SF097_13795 [Acidobacteriota bacterium]|nr:hypothetical protein [Acidobacteriota bacterium]